MKEGAVRLTDEILNSWQTIPAVGTFSRDDRGRMRWEMRYEDRDQGYSVTRLCVFDGEVWRMCAQNKKGRVVVASATREEVAAANARRAPGPPGPFGALDPGSELEGYASLFELDRVALDDDRGIPCWVISGKAGPWFHDRKDAEGSMAAEIRQDLEGTHSIRIRIRRDNLWIRSMEILDANGGNILSSRSGDPDLSPTFDAATFTFQRPANAEDVPFFPKGP